MPETTDGELIELLAEIKVLALKHYPFPEGAENDPDIAVALGQIAGICDRVIHGGD